MAYTANLGGQIRHTEIRTGADATVAADSEAPERTGDEHRSAPDDER
jgi:hypothetical protein